MNLTIDSLYEKIQRLDQTVKENLRNQGIVIPKKYKDGSIGVGLYRIVKQENGFYSILNHFEEAIVENINLPQTAAIIANKLALGKFIDDKILNSDRRYGYAVFDELLHTRLAKKSIEKNDLDQADLFYTKAKISKTKRDRFKKEINLDYEKLLRFR